MRDETRETLLPLALLSAASGARTMAGVAAVSPRRSTAALAAAEMIADKVPIAPNRTEPALILGRMAAGALIGALVGRRTGMNPRAAAAIGAMTAFASTHATYRVRRALMARMPAVTAAFVEDALVAGVAAAGAVLLRRERSS